MPLSLDAFKIVNKSILLILWELSYHVDAPRYERVLRRTVYVGASLQDGGHREKGRGGDLLQVRNIFFKIYGIHSCKIQKIIIQARKNV